MKTTETNNTNTWQVSPEGSTQTTQVNADERWFGVCRGNGLIVAASLASPVVRIIRDDKETE